MSNTATQFKEVMSLCKRVFMDKMEDYGSAWRILRTSSLTDQIYIKANRIRSLQEKGINRVDEGIEPEFIGIVNYSVMALIQLDIGVGKLDKELKGRNSLSSQEIEELYDKHINISKDLMLNKNHDYDEAWRNMRVSSLDDIILMKLMRVKEIEDNEGVTNVSEGLDANYQDIVNYALFALILLSEEKA